MPSFLITKLFSFFAGVINRGDSFRRRRSRSNSLAPTSPMQQAPETLASNGPVDSHTILLVGAPGVGKAALLSQFRTSECINAYETGRGKSEWSRATSFIGFVSIF